jgi:hypothetical protein
MIPSVLTVPGGALPAHLKYLSRLDGLFRRKRAALLDDLRAALGTVSRATVFRILRAAGYFTSYSHAGRYYTLGRIPKFDGCGLWSWRGIGFSSRGTLRATLVFLIAESPAGQTHEELRQPLGLRVHDTLRSLVLSGAIGREPCEDAHLYLNPDPKKAAAQLAARRQLQPPAPAPGSGAWLDPALVIDVLAEVIHHAKEDAAAIAVRLLAAGRPVTAGQAEEVFRRHDVKKTARSRSRASQP